LNANRDIIESTLREMFGGASGKPDLNNTGSDQVADFLRGPLQAAGGTSSEQELQDMVKAIKSYRDSKNGIIGSFEELSSVAGVTPQAITALKETFSLGPFAMMSADVVGPKIGAELERKAIYATLLA